MKKFKIIKFGKNLYNKNYLLQYFKEYEDHY